MNSLPTCPDANVLKALVEDRLPNEQLTELQPHLEACGCCQQKLDSLDAGDSAMVALRDHLRAARTRVGTALQAAIDDVKSRPIGERDEVDTAKVSLDFLSASDNPEFIGRIGRYEVSELVGHGGMGVVLKGYDTQLKRVVAIKVLAPQLASNANARKRFRREGQAAAAVSHDHVVTIHAVDEHSGLPLLVMEYISGQSLQDRINRDGPLELTETLRIGAQAASGLAAAHAQGLVHRDIKPANILLENSVERVKLTDFGLARAVDDVRITHPGVVTGTPEYMSPEQARSEPVDHRTDLFSLGCVLYAMCTGRPPFRADSTVAMIRRVCEGTPRPIQQINPNVPDWLAEIINRLLTKTREHRFDTASEVAELLSGHLAHLQQPGAHPAPPRLPRESYRPSIDRGALVGRRRWMAALAVLLLLFAGLGFTENSGVTNVTGTVIRLVQGEGTLVIEVDDPDVEVALDGEGELVISGAGVQTVRLCAGSHRVKAFKDGKTVYSELISISRGGRRIVRVRQETPVPTKAICVVWEHAPDVTGAISADGKYLSYVDWETGDLSVRDLEKEQDRHLTNKGSWDDSSEFAFDGGAAFSPDGQQLAYVWFNQDGFFELRTIGVDGTTPRVLFRDEDTFPSAADWSPDRKQVLALFQTEESHQIVMISTENGSVRVVKSMDERSPANVRLSPDGRFIVYDYPPRADSADRDIFLLSVDGTREIPLISDVADDTVLDWAPDGGRILYASDRRGTRDAWLIHLADGTPQGVPELAKTDIGSTGTIVPIGFTQSGSYYFGVATRADDVYIATLDPSSGKVVNQPVLASQRMVGSNTSPHWSPDGQYLAYLTRRRGHRNTITIHSPETGAERDLETQLQTIFLKGACWSPDAGSFIVAGADWTGRRGIFEINAETGDVAAIVKSDWGEHRYQQPEWTPDGKVVFVSLSEADHRVVLHDPATRQENTIVGSSANGELFFALSPDGQRVAFAANERGSATLKVVPVSGGEGYTLWEAHRPEMVRELTWTPDGRHVVVRKSRRDNGKVVTACVWQIPFEDGQPQRLELAMKGVRFLRFSPDGRRVAFTASPQTGKSDVWVMEHFLPPLAAERKDN